MMKKAKILKTSVLCHLLLLLASYPSMGQEDTTATVANIQVKAMVVDEHTIKLRWAPANTRAWSEGKKYGYTVERYTLIADGVLLEPENRTHLTRHLLPKPLPGWESAINKSDYAAVIAQAFYGENFALTAASGNLGDIINQANELEQRFATSVFMAEYDYGAAELAGWAWTDSAAKKNEKYLYRICLNHQRAASACDTAVVFTGYDDNRELPQPVGLHALFGDKSVMLTWNYALQANIYHSYHVERMSPGDNSFKRITQLPVTVLNMDMRELFYTDSFPENGKEYAYRIIGVTSFGINGAVSDTVRGQGKKTVSCVPHIYNGDYIAENTAHIYWEFDCAEMGLVDKMQLLRSDAPDGDYQLILDNIPVAQREQIFNLQGGTNYLKMYAVNKDSAVHESFPFLIKQIDSIPPVVPAGLKVAIDTLGIARLSWEANVEPDLRGYRILRSFTKEEEKSSITPELITQNEYTDTLSLDLLNEHVYYAVTALDIRYNESQPCKEVMAVKPNRATPDEPVFTSYEISGNKITLSWITDKKSPKIKYALIRHSHAQPESLTTLATGDYKINTYTDEPTESGTYRYHVTATAPNGKTSVSPQPVEISMTVEEELNKVSGFNSRADRKNHIELSWKKHDKAQLYRIYKQAGDKPVSLWKEIDASQNRITDEYVSPDTRYKYTIVYISQDGRVSQSKTIVINY